MTGSGHTLPGHAGHGIVLRAGFGPTPAVDVAARLQAAVDLAQETGRPILLPPGAALLGTPVTWEQPVTIVGCGRQHTTLKLADGLDDYGLKFLPPDAGGIVGARLADFLLDCNAAEQGGGGGILADGAVQCYFDRLWVTNPYDWGLVLGPATGGAFGHHNRVDGCLFDATVTPGGLGGGLHMTSSDENWVTRSDFEGLGGDTNPAGLTAPVAVLDAAGLQTVSGACFVGGRNNATAMRAQDTKGTKVVGCTFDGTAGHSVLMTGSLHIVAGNVVSGPGEVGSAAASGIYLEFGARGCTVTGNTLETATVGAATHSLLRETGDGDAGFNVIAHNTVRQRGAPTVGLTSFSGTGSTTTPNVVANAA